MADASVTPKQVTGAGDVHEDDVPMLRTLAQLQDLHNQLNSLRTLLPRRLLAPITTTLHPDGSLKAPSPAARAAGQSPNALFAELSRIAKDGVAEVEKFKDTWHSDAMEQLWDKGKDMSKFSGRQGNDVWNVDYASSISRGNIAGKQVVETSKDDGGMDIDSKPEAEAEDVDKVVENFKSTHPALQLNRKEGNTDNDIELNLKVSGMTFRIHKVDDNNNHWDVQEHAEDGRRHNELQKEITTYVNNERMKKKRKETLDDLLQMLASYHDVKTRACDKCDKVIDERFSFPSVRRRTEEETSEEEAKWLAYHPTCVV